jgi:single-stranded DNA-binding protein
MPTNTLISVLGHSYGSPREIPGKDDQPGAGLRFWTTEKPIKGNGKVFISWECAVWGLEAKWLLESVKKGSLLLVSGVGLTMEEFKKQDGTASRHLKILRVSSARCLDARDDQAAPADQPAKIGQPTTPTTVDGDSDPPF